MRDVLTVSRSSIVEADRILQDDMTELSKDASWLIEMAERVDGIKISCESLYLSDLWYVERSVYVKQVLIGDAMEGRIFE